MASYLSPPYNLAPRGDSSAVQQPFLAPNLTQGQATNIPGLALMDIRTTEAAFFATAYPMLFAPIIGATAAVPTTYVMLTMGRNYHSVQVSGTFSATVLIEATADGVNWVTLTSVTTPAINQYIGLYVALRVSVPTFASGTVNVTAMSQRC